MLMTFIASIIVWICISIGSAAVFKKEIPIKPLTYVYGLASGVMLAAVFFSLLGPSLEAAAALDQYPLLPGVLGFLLGCLFVYAIERAMPGPDGTWCTCLRRHKLENSALRQSLMIDRPDENSYRLMEDSSVNGDVGTHSGHSHGPKVVADDGPSNLPLGLSRRTLLLLVAIFFHHIPEGIAMGVAYGAITGEANANVASQEKALKEAMILTLGLCISSLPEGMAVSLPLRKEGLSPVKSWAFASLSGFPTMLGAFIGALAVNGVQFILPWALAFAAGAMIYVVIREMLPEAMGLGEVDIATIGFLSGFILLMSLDVIFDG